MGIMNSANNPSQKRHVKLEKSPKEQRPAPRHLKRKEIDYFLSVIFISCPHRLSVEINCIVSSCRYIFSYL